MPTNARQSALFTSEQWERAYEALTQIDFRAYDQDSLRRAIFEYVRTTYPEEYDDWIGSSEFVIRVDVLSWLAQNVSWRVDLSSRESFLPTAERRDSILRLAENVMYSASRARGAKGEVKITAIRSTQPLVDADGTTIDKVKWSDPNDPDWQEKFSTVMNAALSGRCPVGRPIKRYSSSLGGTVSLYRLNSLAPGNGVYPFSASVGGSPTAFELTNVDIDPLTGYTSEIPPSTAMPFHVLNRIDGRGTSSPGTGFFLSLKQGTMSYHDVLMSSPVAGRSISIPSSNVDQDDVWVLSVAADGSVVSEWQRADAARGYTVGFFPEGEREIFEVLSGAKDSITIRFGDGTFGKIPEGNFRVWYRTVSQDARPVKATDIRDKQVVIPYASGGLIYNLTVWFELSGDLLNASQSERDADIKYRASKVFYSQNRMVTGEDYSGFVLRDNTILKARATNRTYSGHGANARMNDPTSTHSSVRMIADDGRLYKAASEEETVASADPSQLPLADLFDNTIALQLRSDDLRTLYLIEYPEIAAGDAKFVADSVVASRSRGRFRTSANALIAVGDAAPDGSPFALVGADAVLRTGSYDGPIVRVDYVVGDGSASSSVLLKGEVETGTPIYSVMPAFRSEMTDAERAMVIENLSYLRTFGLRWDGPTASWQVVRAEDISSDPFSLDGAGDITGGALDASWMLKLEYVPAVGSDDMWSITRRGLDMRFESDRDVRFYHASGTVEVDIDTGRPMRDSIRILRSNESRDSLSRLGRTTTFGVSRTSGMIVLTGDGTRTDFDLLTEVADETRVFVEDSGEAVPPNRYEIVHASGTDKISFFAAVPDGEQRIVRYEPSAMYMPIGSLSATGNGSTSSYDLGVQDVMTDNAMVFVGGLYAMPGSSYSVLTGSGGTDWIAFNGPIGNGVKVRGLIPSGRGYAMATISAIGDGVATGFPTRYGSSKLFVFVDGALTKDWTLNTTDPANHEVEFDDPIGDGSIVDIVVVLAPPLALIAEQRTIATASQSALNIAPLGAVDGDGVKVLCWLDGVMAGWTYANTSIGFNTPLSAGVVIDVAFFSSLASVSPGISEVQTTAFEPEPEYIGADRTLLVTGNIKHDDGYTNPAGVVVVGEDSDFDTDPDDPFLFKDLVLSDGTDKVIWRKIDQLGADVWDPIGTSTVPRATLEGEIHSFAANDPVVSPSIGGDVHLLSDGTFLLADPGSGYWIEAPDQTQYRWEIGRGNLSFIWDHHAPEENRIDPAPTNVIDMFVLTSGYDVAVRAWAKANSPADQFPSPERTDVLKATYGKHELSKMISDAIVWRASKYKPLFGQRSAPELRAKIVVVRAPGAGINDQDLRLRILSAIDEYFNPFNWDFGETFYFTELAGYIHARFPTLVRSIVAVPRSGTGTFGRLFQVRAEPDELFVSCASPEDIEVADSLTESAMKVV